MIKNAKPILPEWILNQRPMLYYIPNSGRNK